MRTISYLIGATFCFLRECTVTLTEQASTISLLRTKVCTDLEVRPHCGAIDHEGVLAGWLDAKGAPGAHQDRPEVEGSRPHGRNQVGVSPHLQ